MTRTRLQAMVAWSMALAAVPIVSAGADDATKPTNIGVFLDDDHGMLDSTDFGSTAIWTPGRPSSAGRT